MHRQGSGGPAACHRYKLRAAVDIADVSHEHAVWTSFGWGAERQGARTAFADAAWLSRMHTAT